MSVVISFRTKYYYFCKDQNLSNEAFSQIFPNTTILMAARPHICWNMCFQDRQTQRSVFWGCTGVTRAKHYALNKKVQKHMYNSFLIHEYKTLSTVCFPDIKQGMSSTSSEEHSSDTGKPWALQPQGYLHSWLRRSVTAKCRDGECSLLPPDNRKRDNGGENPWI